MASSPRIRNRLGVVHFQVFPLITRSKPPSGDYYRKASYPRT